ncbi:MAG: xanthine and dehydrogenase maturation factor XdhC/CoxF family-like protein [Ferruginibacter sp.]|nr:xanthine and dehydrogenase maturation factor XdhC/CoxF family-like protein [Ferruginibacter sp.]
MHKQLPTWQLIQKSLQQKTAVMLLYVLESKGSSPGRQGFLMAVNTAGETSGSLGGGIMEHKFVEMAKAKLRQNILHETSLHYQFHDKEAAKNQSGMICSGEQTIFFYKVLPGEINIIDTLIRSLEQNKNGTLQLSPEGIDFSEDIPASDFTLELETESTFVYREKTGYKNYLHIIGGGHCALAFSRLMSTMDFFITLYDDRRPLNTIEQNQFAHEVKILDDYSQVSSMIPSGTNRYVVIMTVGYRTDEIALRALLAKDFKYIGLLGSKTKTNKLLKDLQAEGFANDVLSRIHAPVGMAIKSQSPEEIAVSIAAEIIQVKNRLL